MLLLRKGKLISSPENEYRPSDRFAYKTNHKDPIYIPVNRIRTPYQTDNAINNEKVKENVQKIKNGKPLEPIVIGYDYDLHDGHHRLEAAMKVGHTHVPCIVGGRNERRVKAAEKRYRRVWKNADGAPTMSDPTKTRTMYHATWEKDLKFVGGRPIKNYNQIGSWFTSDPDKAREYYGPYVHEVQAIIRNPLEAKTDDFDKFFYNPEIAPQFLGLGNGKSNVTREDMTAIMNNPRYIKAFKRDLIRRGYDAIVWNNSTIDLPPDGSEGRHTVTILLHPEKQIKEQKLLPNAIDGLIKAITFFTGGRVLVKKLSATLASKVAAGDAHWVTVKEGPLEGRHILIDGPRPDSGQRSKGKILAGKGIPQHVIHKLSGATHAHEIKHEYVPNADAPADGMERINYFARKHKTGNYSAADVKDQYKHLMENKESVIASVRRFLDSHPDYKKKRKATKDEIAQKTWSKAVERLAYTASDTLSWSPFSEKIEDAVGRIVNGLTDETINAHIGKKKEKAEKEAEHKRKVLENPETLQELRQKKEWTGGRLSDEEQARLDELEALERRKQNQAPETRRVEPVASGTSFDISKTKHTKTGADLWVVKPKERVGRDEYKDMERKMKAIGGYYSRFVHGFVFDHDPSEKVAGLQGGGAETQNPKASEDYKASRQQQVASRLREVAENMQAAIDAKRADRLTNTARRAAMAASAEADADKMERTQKIMRNVADAIERGEATHLDGLSTRTQVETLESILRRSKWENDRLNGVSWEKSKEHEPSIEDIKSIEYPKPHANVDALRYLIRDLNGVPGTRRASEYLSKLVDQAQQRRKYSIEFDHGSRTYEEVQKLIDIGKNNPKTKHDADRLNDGLMESKRLQAMGIETSEQLRAALREFVQHRNGSGVSEEEKRRRELRDMEQQVTRQNIAGFFPTPKNIVGQMIDLADIKPGMKVLEPSAGKGNIADAIKENHKDADLHVVEYNNSLSRILEHKGHNLVGDDFLQHRGEYDRIIMNPPFENGQDIDHVRHAFEMLKPGGKLVAIMSEGPFFRGDKKSQEFRNWMETHSGESEQLPPGTFKDSERSTGVNTRMVVLEKPKNHDMSGLGMQTYKSTTVVSGGRLLVKKRSADSEGRWVTIRGHHVKINGRGEIMEGHIPDWMKEKKVKNRTGNQASKKLTPYDTPEIIRARNEVKKSESTHLINTPERQQLRKKITDQLYGTGAKNKNRRIDIVIGPPAAGKSSVLAEPLAKRHGALLIDSDMAKELLPEFNGGLGANAVHEESSHIVEGEDGVLERALRNGDNIILPIVGRTASKIRGLRDAMKQLGYEVHLHLNELPPEKAAQRAVQRFKDTGRFVDPHYVLNHVGWKPTEVYGILKEEGGFDSYEKYSNDVPRGQKPKIIERITEVGSDKTTSRRRETGKQNSGHNQSGPQGSKTKKLDKNAHPRIGGHFLFARKSVGGLFIRK